MNRFNKFLAITAAILFSSLGIGAAGVNTNNTLNVPITPTNTNNVIVQAPKTPPKFTVGVSAGESIATYPAITHSPSSRIDFLDKTPPFELGKFRDLEGINFTEACLTFGHEDIADGRVKLKLGYGTGNRRISETIPTVGNKPSLGQDNLQEFETLVDEALSANRFKLGIAHSHPLMKRKNYSINLETELDATYSQYKGELNVSASGVTPQGFRRNREMRGKYSGSGLGGIASLGIGVESRRLFAKIMASYDLGAKINAAGVEVETRGNKAYIDENGAVIREEIVNGTPGRYTGPESVNKGLAICAEAGFRF